MNAIMQPRSRKQDLQPETFLPRQMTGVQGDPLDVLYVMCGIAFLLHQQPIPELRAPFFFLFHLFIRKADGLSRVTFNSIE